MVTHYGLKSLFSGVAEIGLDKASGYFLNKFKVSSHRVIRDSELYRDVDTIWLAPNHLPAAGMEGRLELTFIFL